MEGFENGTWDNQYQESFVRAETDADGKLTIYEKPYGHATEDEIPQLTDLWDEVWRRSSLVFEITRRVYDRGRLLPDPELHAKAVAFAIEHHTDQRRKDPHQTPYIAHLMGVSALALEDGAIPTEAIAALLHDTLEDCRTVTEEMLVEEFGEDVRRMVVGCTDRFPDDGIEMRDWNKRKQRYLDHLAAAEDDVLLVSNADKLHNLMSFVADFQTRDPKDVVKGFGKTEGLRWYYSELGNIFAHRRPGERNQLRFAANLIPFLAGLDKAEQQ